jgi:hypothetical protein
VLEAARDAGQVSHHLLSVELSDLALVMCLSTEYSEAQGQMSVILPGLLIILNTILILRSFSDAKTPKISNSVKARDLIDKPSAQH